MLPEAKIWLRDQGPSIEDLLTDFIYNRARDRARQRVRTALSGGDEEDPVLLSDIEAEMELLSHPLTRLIVSACDEPFLLRHFAVAESKRLSRVLEKDAGQTVAAIANELGIPHRTQDTPQGIQYGIHMADFLLKAPNEKAWHLSKRDPQRGVVWLAKEDFVRLLEEVYKGRIEADLAGKAKQVPALVHETFGTEIERLKQEAAERAARFKQADYAAIVPEIFPPCMKRILSDMHEHRNIPHMGRFAVVTFLHTLGMDADEILKFFSSVPDFDPEKSRYQIEHITGKGGPTEYTPPGCAAMQSYGVCPLEERDHICADVKHPLAYYRKTLWRHEQDQKRKGNGNANANGNAKDDKQGQQGQQGQSGPADHVSAPGQDTKRPTRKPVAAGGGRK